MANEEVVHVHRRNEDWAQVDLVVLQGTSFCNLNCSYCYLSEASRRSKAEMPLSVLEVVFSRILSSCYVADGLHVSWHSGEPLVLSPQYYATAINTVLALKDKYLPASFKIRFDIQTNATLIDRGWCDFFDAYRAVLNVGISCDGPGRMHDLNRVNWAGKPTHAQVVRGMDMMRDRGLRFDMIAVVSPTALDDPDGFIRFFAPYGESIREFHFNLFDEFGIDSTDDTAIREYCRRYDQFIRRLLHAYAREPTLPPCRNFTTFYDMLRAGDSRAAKLDARSMSRPLKSLTIDAAGNVLTFYAGLSGDECGDVYQDGRGLVVGNLVHEDLSAIASSPKLKRMQRDFEVSHRACESACDYHAVCSGGYNVVKFKRYGTFDAHETPECRVHVKTFADAMLDEMRLHERGST
jgi:uncharacterized protein